MGEIVHPKDPTLRFPFVKDTLDPPEVMMKNLFLQFYLGQQDYDSDKNILYRPYEKSYILDSISCHFNEHIRVQDVSNKRPTLAQTWKSMDPDLIRSFKTNDEIREFMKKKYKVAEVNHFCTGLALRFYLGFNDSRTPVKIIDPSSGWGDRMIAAIAAGDYVSQYDGYDPRKDLIVPYDKIMKTLDSKNKCRFFCQPFETAEVPKQYYDLGVTSPPYFDLEVYGNDPDQSIAKGRDTYPKWLEGFYFPFLKNLVFAIRPGGKIILYISDYRNNKGELIDLEKATLDILTKRIGGVRLTLKGELRPQNRNDPTPKFSRPFFVFTVL